MLSNAVGCESLSSLLEGPEILLKIAISAIAFDPPFSLLRKLPKRLPEVQSIANMAENEFQDLFEDSELLQEWPLIQGPDTEIPRGSLKDMNESSRLIQGSPSGYINSLQGDNNEDSLQRRVISWEDDFNTLSPSHLECNVPSCLLENPIDRHTQQLAFDDAAPLSDENSQPQQQIVVTKIETIIASILDGLVNGEPVTIPIKRRSQSSEVKKEPARRSRFSYPGSAAREAWQFSKPTCLRLAFLDSHMSQPSCYEFWSSYTKRLWTMS